MSKWHANRERKAAHKQLNRFSIRKLYRVSGGQIDYSDPYYRVRPKGYDTVLFDVTRPSHVALSDFEQMMDAVKTMTEATPR
jgi:hypothetical protein